jgi:FixJ family two-component response regulator
MSETDAMVFVVDDDAPMRESLKNLTEEPMRAAKISLNKQIYRHS